MATLMRPMLASEPSIAFPPHSLAVPASSSAAHTLSSLSPLVSHRQTHSVSLSCSPLLCLFMRPQQTPCSIFSTQPSQG